MQSSKRRFLFILLAKSDIRMIGNDLEPFLAMVVRSRNARRLISDDSQFYSICESYGISEYV